jgi:hypothetical protein
VYVPRVVNSSCEDGDACTEGGLCNEQGVCVGVTRACNTPPASECIASDTVFRTYSSPGSCDPISGDCAYPVTDTPCAGCTVNCLQCDEHADCAPNGYCNAANECTQRVADGGACGGIGNEACVSRYCDGTLCCDHGDCCNNPGNCAATYTTPSVCLDPSPATQCQGQRRDRACNEHVCGSQAIDDDSGCDGIAHACADNLAPVVCGSESSQNLPVCLSACGSDVDCAAGFRCDAPTCVLPAGTGAPCSGSGQGTCDDGLKCERGVCCAAGGPACCDDAGDCAGGLRCNEATAACLVTCNDYDSSACADSGDYCLDDTCVPKLDDGSDCVSAGACDSGYCANGHCCQSGDCCRVAGDCPSSYSLPSSCDVTGPSTTCQGTSSDATCVGSICGTTAVGDDSGCTGEVRLCPDHFAPTVCTAEPAQAVAGCATVCDDSGDCAAGFICVAPACVTPIVTVAPVYAAHAAWNDYVANDDPGADLFHQDDVACAGTEVGRDACIHAGELRQVVVTTAASCDGLALEEDLGAFTWICQDAGGVTFYSTGFASGKGLRDLVSGSGFLPNAVSVRRGGGRIAYSNPAIWWSNPVLPLPPNAGGSRTVLDAAGTIYVAASPADSPGYNVNADRIGVVTLAGATLSWSGAANNCRRDTGEVTSTNTTCLLAAGAQRFLWLEAAVTDPSGVAELLVLWVGVSRSRMHGLAVDRVENPYREAVTLRGASNGNRLTDLTIHGSELALLDADYNRIERVRVTSPGSTGFDVELSDHNSFAWLSASGGVGSGVLLQGSQQNAFRHVYVADFGRGLHLVPDSTDTVFSQRNVFADVTIANLQPYDEWDGEAIRLANQSTDNTLVSLLATGADRRGIYDVDDANRNTFSHVTTAHHGNGGFVFGSPADLTIVQALAINNQDSGVGSFWQFTTGCRFSHIYASLNNSNGLNFYDVQDLRFVGDLWVGNNGGSECYLGGTNTNPGLVHNTCSETGLEGSHIFAADPTTAVLHVDRDPTASFAGKLTADEPVNQSDSAGARSYANITDWLGFANRFRVWGADGGAFPDWGNRTACVAGQTCRIWDWRLVAADTQVRNVHGVFTDGAACPASVDGTSGVLEDKMRLPWESGINAVENVGNGGDEDGLCEAGETCHNRFLVAAAEVLDDGRGDDDGLCESSEACIYSPNVGVYQGEGDYATQSCTFTGGLVTGVEMHAYPVNGI